MDKTLNEYIKNLYKDEVFFNGKPESYIRSELIKKFPQEAIGTNNEVKRSYDYIKGEALEARLFRVFGSNLSNDVEVVSIAPIDRDIYLRSKGDTKYFDVIVKATLTAVSDCGKKIWKTTGISAQTKQMILGTNESMESAVKGATTSAIKHAAKHWGVGLYLYFNDHEDLFKEMKRDSVMKYKALKHAVAFLKPELDDVQIKDFITEVIKTVSKDQEDLTSLSEIKNKYLLDLVYNEIINNHKESTKKKG